MRHAILPVSAMIMSRGSYIVADLRPGDQVKGYDPHREKLAMATICAINSVEPVQKVLAQLTRFKVIPIAKETVGLTPTGEKTILASKQFLGFCHNKMRPVLRELEHLTEYNDVVSAVELQWEWPDYIWFEGILVGTAL